MRVLNDDAFPFAQFTVLVDVGKSLRKQRRIIQKRQAIASALITANVFVDRKRRFDHRRQGGVLQYLRGRRVPTRLVVDRAKQAPDFLV